MASGTLTSRSRSSKNWLVGALCVATVQLLACEAADAPFDSADGRFRVRMPGTPEHTSGAIDTMVGSYVEHSYHVSGGGGLVRYFISRFRKRPITYSVSYVDIHA